VLAAPLTGLASSQSTRSIWCAPLIMRVLSTVGRDSSIAQPPVSIPMRVIISRSARPFASSPSTPTTSTSACIAVRFAATLPAPPRRSSRRFAASTGIGASGEMRATSPVTYASRIRSPTMSTRGRPRRARIVSSSRASMGVAIVSSAERECLRVKLLRWPLPARA
jgi:hypothetical protein